MSTEHTGLLGRPSGAMYDSNEVAMTEMRGHGKEKKKDKKKKKEHHQAHGDSSDEDDGPLLASGEGDRDSPRQRHTHIGINTGDEHTEAAPTHGMLSLAKSKYDMKNHMANERTFFKYLFTGLHLGSIGTLVLTYFSANDASKLLLVAFIWLIAFGFMFWGLAGYYRRKHLMETGQFKETQHLNPHMPSIVTGLFVAVVILVIGYSAYSHQWPNKDWKAVLSVHTPASGAHAAPGHVAGGKPAGAP